MKVHYLNGSDQSDYCDGCLQISAENKEEAFNLGGLFATLLITNEAVAYKAKDADGVSIRIPLTEKLRKSDKETENVSDTEGI